MNKQQFLNEIKNDIKNYNLSGVKLINFFYNNYIDDNRYFDKDVQYTMMCDRHNANQKDNIHLINWLAEHREDFYREVEFA